MTDLFGNLSESFFFRLLRAINDHKSCELQFMNVSFESDVVFVAKIKWDNETFSLFIRRFKSKQKVSNRTFIIAQIR